MSADGRMATRSDYEAVQRTVGVLGGGQLGRMMATAAQDLGFRLVVLDPTPNSPAGQVCTQQIVGDFKDADKIAEVARVCDVLTVEIEHVNCDALEAGVGGKPVQPSPATVRLIQDKYLQKEHLRARAVPVADFRAVAGPDDVRAAAGEFGYPLMLKSRTLAYDGRGNAAVQGPEGVEGAIAGLVSQQLYVERWCPFVKELAVMVVRALDGQVRSYPVVETLQRDNICHVVFAPAQIDGEVQQRAQELAEQAVATFEGAGIYGVELFLGADGQLVVNEIAPRPHNSGHYTIEACHTSQFENHIRAVLGLPLGSTAMRVSAAIMVNVLGAGSDMDATWQPFARALAHRGASVHWYGKQESKLGRKMGHITLTGASMGQLLADCTALGLLDAAAGQAAGLAPVVGVIMGSDSDLPAMKACCQVLQDFGVPFEVTIVSAHRTPDRLVTYARSARARGLKVVIAAAGGAAHLPGMTAAMTSLPVIGVPIPLRHLDGVDSLYSICQMPRGVPVATVAIGNSTNAALLAVRMVGLEQPHLLDAMEAYQARMDAEVHAKVATLAKVGWEKYGEPKAH